MRQPWSDSRQACSCCLLALVRLGPMGPQAGSQLLWCGEAAALHSTKPVHGQRHRSPVHCCPLHGSTDTDLLPSGLAFAP